MKGYSSEMIQFLCKKLKNFRISSSLSIYDLFKNSLCTPKKRLEKLTGRVPFHILKKGSMTVEAALMIPLFLMMCICMASIINIFPNTLDKMVSLRNRCEESALYYAADKEFIFDIKEYESFSPIFSPQAVLKTDILCSGRARAWNGRISEDYYDKAQQKHEYVYVTDNGSVYHTDADCTHIKLSIKTASGKNIRNMRNRYKEKYKPCEKCIKGSLEQGVVYITDTGNRYHSSHSCSGLKRTVKMVDIAETGAMRECTRCGSKK